MRWEWGILILIFVLILVIGYYVKYTPRSGKAIESVIINGSRINIETADTIMKQAKGLSGRNSLRFGEGMLFVYKKAGFYSFWMKDMNFPIDIIWIDENFLIVDITSNIQPDSFPRTFVGQKASKYVLEINAGAAKNIAKVGDIVTFDYAH